MLKRFGKLLLAFGVLCLLFAGALLLFRTSLVAYGLTLILERQGAQQVTVAIKRVDTEQVHIEHLNFVLPRGSRLLDLELENLTVSFAPAELLHGQVQDIVLEQLRLRQSITAERTPAEPSAPFELPKLLSQLAGDWQNWLPFSSATIASIQLFGPDLPPALRQPLTLAIARTASGIKVDCRPVSPTTSADVRLMLEKDSDALSVNAAAAEAGELAATLAGERLDGSFSLDPARLNSLLVLLGVKAVQVFDQLNSSRLTGTFTANLNRWPLFDMRAHLAAESLTLAETTFTGLNLEFALEAVDLERVRRPLQAGRLRVVVDQLSQADFALAGVAGQFALTAGENGNYHLEETSVFKVAAFESANTSFQDAHFPLSGNLSLTDDNQLQLHLDGEDRWRVTGLKSADISMEEATLQPALNLQLTTASARLDCTPTFRVNLDQLSIGDLRIPALALQPSATAQLHIDWAEGLKWRLQNSRWRIQLPLMENARMQVRPNEVTLRLTELAGEGRAVFLSGKAQTERIAIAAADRNAYLRNLDLNFSLTPKEIEGEGDFFIGPYQQPLSFSVQHKLASGRGTFRLATPSPLELSEQLPLSRILKPWEFPGDAMAGRIDLTLAADWASESELTAVAEIGLEDIDGKWQEITFSGLSLSHRFKVWPVIDSLDRALLSLNLIVASGVPITEVQATLRLLQAGQDLAAPLAVELEEGQFNLFGSTFSLTPFTYRSNAADNRVRIKTAKLNLAQLTPLFKTEGLQLNGLVAAILPLELGRAGVEIVAGTIRQNGPGVIIYRPQDREMLKRTGMPEIVIKALENFHYDSLEVDVAYQPDGQLDLAVRLKGKNPTAETERPIHLNLNIEQNLLSLLESLRYSDVFGRKIEEYMEKKK